MEETGLLSERSNIICLSDEAHRTQISLEGLLKSIKRRKIVSEHKGFAQFLHDAFPNATFVGFSGTPWMKLFKHLAASLTAIPCSSL